MNATYIENVISIRKATLIALALTLIAPVVHADSRDRAVRRQTATAPPPANRTVADGPWSVEIRTSGGISGGGVGDLKLSSDGHLAVGQFVQGGKVCDFQLPAGEMSELAAAVKQLRSDLWFTCYIPADPWAACCDMIYTTVIVTRPEIDPWSGRVFTFRYETQLQQELPALPHDLVDLWSRLSKGPESYLSRYLPLCR